MTKREITGKNIGMTFDFIRFLIEHPEAIEEIPDNAELQFIDKDFPIEGKRGKKRQIAVYRVGHIFEAI